MQHMQLQECIGSAVIAVGPEKILSIVPINPNADDRTCSNVWLIPLLRDYVVGSSLQFFMEHIVPLAESFHRVSVKAKKSAIRRDLQANAHGCWVLLPAFCRRPTDTYINFGSLVKLLIPLVTKDSYMLQHIAIALQELVNQNKSVLGPSASVRQLVVPLKASGIDYSLREFESKSYSKKKASKNIKVLASASEELLQALVDVFFGSTPE